MRFRVSRKISLTGQRAVLPCGLATPLSMVRLLIRADETDRAEPPVFDTIPKGMTVGPWERAYVLVVGMVWR